VDEGTARLLLEGRPGIAKTTVARRPVALLRQAPVPIGGFTTAELRTGGRREGFLVEAVSRAQEVLAHVDLPGPSTRSVWRRWRPRVGRPGWAATDADRAPSKPSRPEGSAFLLVRGM
jgi:nucleoside-triphosphatase THEP1